MSPATTARALTALAAAVERMPHPADTTETDHFERELAGRFGARHAVTVSSGTAAIHTALATAGIRPGDEVLVPAATVVMTVAAVVAAGAHPVFVDSPARGLGIDPTDAATKIGPRTRALLCVHLFGHTPGLDTAVELARRHHLLLIEDACQAQGTHHPSPHDHHPYDHRGGPHQGRQAGTIGDIGCFSLKDGKILACGEGGYLLTDNTSLAARAASWRNHGLTDAPGVAAGTRLGHNFRLAQPLAALGRQHLADFDTALARRRQQHDLLIAATATTPGLQPINGPNGGSNEPTNTVSGHNGYSPLWRVALPNPRAFMVHLAERGVVNSVGSFGLAAAPTQPWCSMLTPAPCPRAATTIDHTLAVPVTARHTDRDLEQVAALIDREARAWPCPTSPPTPASPPPSSWSSTSSPSPRPGEPPNRSKSPPSSSTPATARDWLRPPGSNP